MIVSIHLFSKHTHTGESDGNGDGDGGDDGEGHQVMITVQVFGLVPMIGWPTYNIETCGERERERD